MLKAKPKCKCVAEPGAKGREATQERWLPRASRSVLRYGFPTCFGSATERRRWALRSPWGGNGPKGHTGTKENEAEECLTHINPLQQKTNE